MRVGIHLPQYGRVAGAAAITRAAQHAEALGFADIWVSDHIVHPAEQSYPSPYLLDPIVTLTWAAAVTERIGLGTSVLVLPQHNPLELANMLASIDSLSGGRLTHRRRRRLVATRVRRPRLRLRESRRAHRRDHPAAADRVARRPVVVPRCVLRLRRDPRDAASRARHRDLGRRQQRARVPARRRARRRLPDHRRDAGGGEAGDRTHPARPSRSERSRSRCAPDGMRRAWTRNASATSARRTKLPACSTS